MIRAQAWTQTRRYADGDVDADSDSYTDADTDKDMNMDINNFNGQLTKRAFSSNKL
jgi:hypothetical protein